MYSLTIAVGRLTKDPVLKTLTINGENRPVCNFTIACDDSSNNSTDFYNVSVWGKRGESCAQYLSKGREVLVQGRLKTRNRQRDVNGTQVPETVYDIRAEDVRFMGGNKNQSQESTPAPAQQQANPFATNAQQPTTQQQGPFGMSDDAFPF